MTENEQLGKIAYEVRRDLDRQSSSHHYDDIGIPDLVEWEQLPALTQARYINVGAAVRSALTQEVDDIELGTIAYEAFHESTVGVPQAMPYWSTLTSDTRSSFVAAAQAIKNVVLGIRQLPTVIVEAQ